MRKEFIADTEDFAIWLSSKMLVSLIQLDCVDIVVLEPDAIEKGYHRICDGNVQQILHIPSLVHAALSGVRRANRPRERAENFMIALLHEETDQS